MSQVMIHFQKDFDQISLSHLQMRRERREERCGEERSVNERGGEEKRGQKREKEER